MTSTNATTTAMPPAGTLPAGTLPLSTQPSRLFAAGPRADAARHVARFGPVPGATGLVEALRASGLTGRGGGAFPVSRKIDALAGPPATIIANGSEGEPLSRKDATLLEHAPHLVIDGLVLLAAAVGPRARLVVMAHPDGADSVRRALLERRDGGEIEVRVAEDRFVAGEATAVVAGLSGAPATPKDHPVHLTERGVGRRPTLLFNVETLAHIALIARYGAEWFRSSGTADDPGTRLLSVGGDGVAEQVVEVAGGSRLAEVLTAIGVVPASLRAALVGGFHGRWIAAGDFGGRLVARPAEGGSDDGDIAAGAGVVLLLGTASCGLRVSASILDYLAAESAGQCGPCVLGLPRLSRRFAEYSSGRDHDPSGVGYLLDTIPGRGACHHPDGTVSLARSALAVFTGELDRHRSGSCSEGGLA